MDVARKTGLRAKGALLGEGERWVLLLTVFN